MANLAAANRAPASGADDTGETTVLIVDDHRIFADLLAAALATVPGIRCLGTAASAAEGIQRAAELSPSVVVIDIQMPGTDGLAATRRLREMSPGTAVAVVTAHRDAKWLARAAAAGASAFIPKGGCLAEMITMVKEAKPGPMAVAASLLQTRVAPTVNREVREELTQRELEVLGYISQGQQAKTIAKLMGVSIHTCRSHIKTVYIKLGVSSRIEALNRGRQLQLLND